MAGQRYQKKDQPNNSDMAKLQQELAQGIFRRVYLLFGEERYLVFQNRDALMNAAVRPDDTMNLNIHKEAAPDISNLMDQCLSMPFFADRRLVLVQDSGYFAAGRGGAADGGGASGKSEKGKSGSGKGKKASKAAQSPQDRLIELFDTLPETTVLVFSESDVDKRSRLYKAVGKAGMTVEFSHPDGDMLKKWVLVRFRQHRIKVTGEALELLLERTGNDMTVISSQLDKLIACAGDDGAITGKEVRSLVTEKLETRVFDLVDAVGHRDRRGALARYDELIRMREKPNMILYFLERQFSQLYQTKSLTAARKSSMDIMKALDIKYSFLVRKYTEQARLFDEARLRQAVEDCVSMEEMSKSGKIDAQLAVELLLVRYSR